MKLRILFFLTAILTHTINLAQTTIAFQGGEGTAADNWGFAPITNAGGSALTQPGIVSTLPRTGTRSIRAGGGNNTTCSGGSNCITGGSSSATGCSMHGNTIAFNSVNVSCLSGVQLSCYHRSHTLCSGSGFDTGEGLLFQVRLNGGAWTTAAGGTLSSTGGEFVWAYTTTSVAGVANPFIYNVPVGTTTFEFRVVANINRADEVFYLDDVKLTTTTTGYAFPGTSGLWGGYVSTDWFNACNWNDRTIPTSTTNVVFPSNNTGSRDIVINTSTNPICNNLTINGSGSKQIKGEGSATKKLTINGNLTLASTDGLDFSDGTAGSADGTIELYGNWINNGVESDFKEGNSTVKFMGTANQNITTADTEEAFHILNINKSAGKVTMNDDVWIDKDFEGGTNPLLIFTQGNLDLNGNELKLFNDNEQAVSRLAGGIISEKTDNSSKMTWFINNNTGAHLFPFIRTDNFYIPFTFNLTSGDVNEVTISTYPSAANNTPYPITPQTVTHVDDAFGNDNSNNMVNRFWQIDKTGSSGTADLSFTYGDNDWDASEPVNYEARRWASASWQPAITGQTQNVSSNSVMVSGVTAFSPWTLIYEPTVLPIELLTFNAAYNYENTVSIYWTTVTELNNDYFTIEKSTDGMHFTKLKIVKAAGTSFRQITYTDFDEQPEEGILYYRLKQTDFDGSFSYSKVVSVYRKAKDDFMIYPNPNESGILKISNGNSCCFEITLTDPIGKIIHKQSSDDYFIQIDMTSFSKGIYILNITSKVKTTTTKVIYN